MLLNTSKYRSIDHLFKATQRDSVELITFAHVRSFSSLLAFAYTVGACATFYLAILPPSRSARTLSSGGGIRPSCNKRAVVVVVVFCPGHGRCNARMQTRRSAVSRCCLHLTWCCSGTIHHSVQICRRHYLASRSEDGGGGRN